MITRIGIKMTTNVDINAPMRRVRTKTEEFCRHTYTDSETLRRALETLHSFSRDSVRVVRRGGSAGVGQWGRAGHSESQLDIRNLGWIFGISAGHHQH